MRPSVMRNAASKMICFICESKIFTTENLECQVQTNGVNSKVINYKHYGINHKGIYEFTIILLPNIKSNLIQMMELHRNQQDLKLSDELKKNFVCSNPWIGPVISVLYLIIVKLLQKYMENKPAYSLKTLIRIYNLIQICACTKHVLMSFEQGWWWSFSEEYCSPHDFITPFYEQLGNIGIVYFNLKVFDIFDTIFIVLKKKSNQLSFLHLFHHCTTITATTSAIWDREVLLAPCILLNSFVHMVMYSYYFIASFNSQKWVQKYKKYITQLQLIQFGLAATFLLYAILAGCRWKTNTIIIAFLVLTVVTYEFVKFYLTQYSKKRKTN